MPRKRLGTVAVGDAGNARDDALRGHAHDLDLELLAAVLGRQRAIGADVAGLAGIAVDDHVAADAVRADDAAEKNALRLVGHRQASIRVC